MVKKIDSVSKLKKSVKLSSSKSKLKKPLKPIYPEVSVVVPTIPRIPDLREKHPIIINNAVATVHGTPVENLIVFEPVDVDKLVGRFGEIMKKEYSKEMIAIILEKKAQAALQKIFKNKKLSVARQKTLVRNAVFNPDKVINSKKSKDNVIQTISYDYNDTTLIIKITVNKGVVVINDIKAESKTK